MAESIVGTNQLEIKHLVLKPGLTKMSQSHVRNTWPSEIDGGAVSLSQTVPQELVLITLGQDPTKPHGQGEGWELHPGHAPLRGGLRVEFLETSGNPPAAFPLPSREKPQIPPYF